MAKIGLWDRIGDWAKIGAWIKKYFAKSKKDFSWKEIEYFNEEWKNRIQVMAGLITKDEKSILDLGCGKMWLKEYLSPNITYFGCDYKDRGNETLICDFNKKQFPNQNVDVCFISGCLEYIDDVDWFLEQVSKASNSIIVSYCPTDYFPDISDRKTRAWVNHMNISQLVNKITKLGFYLEVQKNEISNNSIFRFIRGS